MITGTSIHCFSDIVTGPLQRGRCLIGFKYEKAMISMSRTPERAVHEEGRRLLRMGINFASQSSRHHIGTCRGCPPRRWDHRHQRATRSPVRSRSAATQYAWSHVQMEETRSSEERVHTFCLFFELNEFLARAGRLGQDFPNQQYD